MSATLNQPDSTTTTLVSKGAFDLDWRRVFNTGGLLALGLCFISLAGMPIGLNGRKLIEPVLSLGYLSLLWLPLVQRKLRERCLLAQRQRQRLVQAAPAALLASQPPAQIL